MSTPKLIYFNLKARGVLPLLVAAYADLPLEWDNSPTQDVWRALKPTMPFGQLPVLEDGTITIAQSMAISRYLARKAGIQGDTDVDFAMSEQLIEEHKEIFTMLVKAKHAKTDEERKVLHTESIPGQLALLEKLLQGDFFASKVTTGDLAIFSVLNVLLDVRPEALDTFPKLKAFYARIAAVPQVDRFLKNITWRQYF